MTIGAIGPIEEETSPPAWPMLRAMVGVGILCGLLIATAYVTTRPAIERNRAEALQAAIFQVVPAASSSKTYIWLEEERFELVEGKTKPASPLVHVGLDDEGAVVGLAIEAVGMGYQDVIRVLYGYSPTQAAIVGLRVLESRETPGLGDRIETDPEFRANFERLDVSLTPDLARVANPVVAVKHGEKRAPWQVDGITGATISSESIAAILRRSTGKWIPRVHQRLEDF